MFRESVAQYPTIPVNAGKKNARKLRVDVKRSEQHTSELQSLRHLVCRLLLEKTKRTFAFPENAGGSQRVDLSAALLASTARPSKLVPACRCLVSHAAAWVAAFFFFFNDTATTEIYTLSLHDALPI